MNIADVRVGGAAAVGHGASLRGTARLDANSDGVRAAHRQRGLEREGTGDGNGKVIAAIVLQSQAGPKQADDLPADGNGSRGTGDHDSSDVGTGCALAAGDRAGLHGSGGRSKDRNVIRLTVGDSRLKRESSVAGDGQVVAAIILQNQSGTSQASDRPADGKGPRA